MYVSLAHYVTPFMVLSVCHMRNSVTYLILRPMLGYVLCKFETEDRQASAKAQEAIHQLASVPLGREEISQPGNRTVNLFLEIWVSLHHHLVG
jgi:hypothetical protein